MVGKCVYLVRNCQTVFQGGCTILHSQKQLVRVYESSLIPHHWHHLGGGVCVCVCCSVVSDSVTPWTVALQAPLSMEFSRQEY